MELFWELNVDKMTLFSYFPYTFIISTIPSGTNYLLDLLLVLSLTKVAFGDNEIIKSWKLYILVGNKPLPVVGLSVKQDHQIKPKEAGLSPVFTSNTNTQTPNQADRWLSR